MEWQNAIMLKTMAKLNFIPVRLDDCNLPSLLLQTLYIDLYTNGIEIALRQMIDVINGDNTFRENPKLFSNLSGIIKINGNQIILEIIAKHYMEPLSSYAVLTNYGKEIIDVNPISKTMVSFGYMDKGVVFNGKVYNAFTFNLHKNTIPGFPERFNINLKDKSIPIDCCVAGVLHEYREDTWKPMNADIKWE